MRRVRSVLGLQYPYRIKTWQSYLDGGTLGVSIVDRQGRTLEFCVDGRLLPGLAPVPDVDTIRVAPRHFYLGAPHPERMEARELPIAGTEEMAILDMLETIALDHYPRQIIEGIAAHPESLGVLWSVPQHTEAERLALQAGILAWNRKRMDPRGLVVWIRPPETGGTETGSTK